MNRTAEECIQSILKDIECRKAVNFGDRKSVRRYNAAMDRIYKNGHYIDSVYPEQIDLLVQLLYHEDVKVILTIATLISKLRNPSLIQRKEAIRVIKELLMNDILSPVEKLGCEANVKTWEQMLEASDQK